MLRSPDADEVLDDQSFNLETKDRDHIIEALNNSIWPRTNIDALVALLGEGGKEVLEMRHGSRKETCLHRYIS